MKEVITSVPELDNEKPLRMLDTRIVDFSDIKEVTDFAFLICQSASQGGMFLKDEQDKEMLERVRTVAKEWVKEIRLRIASMSDSDALEVIHTFDLVHRIAYGKAADVNFINKYTLKAFEARIHGDQAVNEYTLFRQIAVGLNRRDPAYLDRPLEWYTLSLDRWYKEFSDSERPPQLPIYDTIQQVNILLESDLWAYETRNQSIFKRQLFNRHRYLLADFDDYNIHTLRAIYTLVTTIHYLNIDDISDEYRNDVIEYIINNSASTFFLRLAFRLSYTLN